MLFCCILKLFSIDLLQVKESQIHDRTQQSINDSRQIVSSLFPFLKQCIHLLFTIHLMLDIFIPKAKMMLRYYYLRHHIIFFLDPSLLNNTLKIIIFLQSLNKLYLNYHNNLKFNHCSLSDAKKFHKPFQRILLLYFIPLKLNKYH